VRKLTSDGQLRDDRRFKRASQFLSVAHRSFRDLSPPNREIVPCRLIAATRNERCKVRASPKWKRVRERRAKEKKKERKKERERERGRNPERSRSGAGPGHFHLRYPIIPLSTPRVTLARIIARLSARRYLSTKHASPVYFPSLSFSHEEADIIRSERQTS